MGWGDITSAEENEIPKVPHQDHVYNFFDSQGVAHKEFVPDEKTVNAKFYKGVNGSPPEEHSTGSFSCVLLSRFFLLHDNAPSHKAASVCQFFTPKNVTTLYNLPYSPTDYFLFPS
jgi:hypothetical protein